MSKLDTPSHVTIGERKYHIIPFPAFKCVNLTGELGSVILPIMSAVLPLLKENGENIMDTDISSLNLSTAFQNFSGDKLESLIRKLVIENGNVAFTNDNGKPVRLTEDEVDELFCGEVDSLFFLAFEVMRLNFSGFFERILSRFGIQKDAVPGMMEMLKNTVNSTQANSQN